MELSTLSSMPTVKLAMTPFPYFVELHDPLSRAVDLMTRHDVHHVPVQDHGKIKGVIGRTDIQRYTQNSGSDADLDSLRVSEVTWSEPHVVEHWEPLDRVLAQMVDRHIGSVLVTRKGKLVGILSSLDACRILAAALREKFPPSGGEAA